ncbi:ABC transporter ATP-binding protein [Oceanobacillus alkalisoli]|uniref:ABC transporter ATP-binding protein n=1 Tax=Oceanobacillus alkalisoli TaxID=2925113 RepID=UPI001EF10212|nr:ABC transporter ATP-binding protein [Oceanobacillus alkalisoli]MCF3942318.1 ABC transporter ATP-binding protein [Oceanobacillus alkalisoli]MCG5105156.1 ABC transporter ATP-binding protein [Oceanobacillus alkalisoli]
MKEEIILEVSDLRTSFFDEDFEIKAVDGVSFELPKGKTLGIVGESGSGKSITALSILRLIAKNGKVVGGEILFNGKDLTKLSEREIRDIRGNDISMIFQEPMTSLNPVYTIGKQIYEALKVHQGMDKKEGDKRVVELLELVGIPSPKQRMKQYPHELSGGMRQRVMIAMALACNPKLLIADEPTTALDVTIQAQILDLINDLQEELGMSVIMITHDLGVVAETCDYVAVMYGGQVVEYQEVKELFKNPKHPYTVGLLNSMPRHDVDVDELEPIKGNVPSVRNMPKGCRFAPRCPFATELCVTELPELDRKEDGSEVRCWIYSDRWDGDPEVSVRNEERTT